MDMMPRTLKILVLTLACGASASFAADSTGVALPASAAGEPSRSYLLVPFAAYNEETGFQGGALGMYFFPKSPGQKEGGMLIASGVLTTRGQKTAVLGPSGNFDQGRMEASAMLSYSDWPGNWWKGGNDPEDKSYAYDMKKLGLVGKYLLAGDYLRSEWHNFQLGVIGDFENNTTEFAQKSLPDSMNIGVGGLRMGIGPSFTWDTRDQKGWPTRGNFLTVERTFFNSAWGSDWNFGYSNVELRHYHTLYKSLVLALGASWEGVDGTVPFDRLCAPDGSNKLRGLEKGRLRDRQSAVGQAELRFPIAGAFFGTAFAEAGKVGGNANELAKNEFHPGFGAGLRYQVESERKLNFRIDLAWVDNGLGAAASFGEAF